MTYTNDVSSLHFKYVKHSSETFTPILHSAVARVVYLQEIAKMQDNIIKYIISILSVLQYFKIQN